MFGRRRHVAPVAAARPQLSDEQILTLVQDRLAALLGPQGGWTVTRRTEADTDAIFQSVLVRSVAADVARGLVEARRALETAAQAPAGATRGQHVSPSSTVSPVEDAADGYEPAAFGWEPAPITVWADLRRPVTGEIPRPQASAITR